MTVISVDLAYKSYSDIGVTVLQSREDSITCSFVRLSSTTLTGFPNPKSLADYLIGLCAEYQANLLMIDGPQAWKDPNNGLEHSRQCERCLNTPAKTGLPGLVKPKPYTPFVSFSIELFDQLDHRGWHRLQQSTPVVDKSQYIVIESFPLSAWQKLGINSLPAKRKTKATDIQSRISELQRRFPLKLNMEPSHDELQALVAGLAGIAIETGDQDHYLIAGGPPQLVNGIWREGFIVTPKQTQSKHSK